MVTSLPEGVQSTLVTGRFLQVVVDRADPDTKPDGVPLANLKISMIPSVEGRIVRNTAAAASMVIEGFVASTDADGYLGIRPPGAPAFQRGMEIPASDSSGIEPQDWTYRVTIEETTGQRRRLAQFDIVAHADVPIDLTTVIPVPANPGEAVREWERAVEAAEDLIATIPARVGDAIDAQYATLVSRLFALEVAAQTRGPAFYGPVEPTGADRDEDNVWVRTPDYVPHVWDSLPHASASFMAGDPSVRNLVSNPAMVSTFSSVEVRRNLWWYPMASQGLSPAWGSVGGVTIDLLPSENAVDITFPEELTSTENFRAGNVPEVRPSISEGEAAVIAWDVENRSNYPVQLRSLAIMYPDDGSSINWSFISEVFTLQANERRVVSHTTPVADRDGNLRCDLRSPSQTASDKVPGGTVIRVHDGLTVENPGTFQGTTFSGGLPSPDPDLTPSWTGTANASESVLTGARVANVTSPAAAQAVPAFRAMGGPEGATHFARFRVLTAMAVGIAVGNVNPPTGELATLLVWIRAPRDYTRVQMRISGDLSEGFDLPANEWVQKRFTIAAGNWNTGANTGFRFDNGGGHEPGDFIDVALVMLTEGEYAGPYRDGDSPGWVWSGGDGWVPVTADV